MDFLVFLNVLLLPLLCVCGVFIKKLTAKRREDVNGFGGIYKKNEIKGDLTNIL